MWVKFIYGIMCYAPYWNNVWCSNVAVGFRLLGDSFPSRSPFPINPLLILLPCQAFIFFNLLLCFGLLFFSPVEANGNLSRDVYMQSLWRIVCRHFMQVSSNQELLKLWVATHWCVAVCREQLLGVSREIWSSASRFTNKVLKLSWHCRSLNCITSKSHLEGEGKACGSYARASCAVEATHTSRSDIT